MRDRGVLLYNDVAWDRVVAGPIASHIVSPRGDPEDVTSGRHFQDRSSNRPRTNSLQSPPAETLYTPEAVLVPPTEVPGYGYTVVPTSELLDVADWSSSDAETISTGRYEVQFDTERGGIERLYDARQATELVDSTAGYPLAGFVHESIDEPDVDLPRRALFDYPPTVEDWKLAVAGILDAPNGFQSDWQARRTGPVGVKHHRVYETPLGIDVRQQLTTETVESDVNLRVFFPEYRDEIVIEATWEMGMTTSPEATYLAFPFDIGDPTVRIDVGGQPVRPGLDQLPGACQDYFAAQRWVDISNRDRGITVACPLNPMVQLGGFQFGQNKRDSIPDSGHLLGWITNNYWDTNFRARQPGRVHARYHLDPHAGPFDECRAHRTGIEATSWTPIAQSLAEPDRAEPPLSATGSLLDLPDPPILVFQIRQAAAEQAMCTRSKSVDTTQGLVVGLQNASDSTQTATIASAQLRITHAELVGLLGSKDEESTLTSTNGTVSIEIEPRSRASLLVHTGEPSAERGTR